MKGGLGLKLSEVSVHQAEGDLEEMFYGAFVSLGSGNHCYLGLAS